MNLKEELVVPTIKLIKALVGDRLSQSKSSSGTTPSVVRSRSNTPIPEFPYASVSYRNIQKVGIQDRHQYLNDNLDEVTETDFIVKIVIRFHAQEGQDSLGIAQHFKSMLNTTKAKRLIREYFPSSGLLNTSNVSFYPALMLTDYEEESRITLDFWTRSIIVDDTTGVIERVSVDGELYEDYDQDYPPLTLNTKAP